MLAIKKLIIHGNMNWPAEINALISQLSAFSQTVRGALSSGTIDTTQFASLSAEMSTLQSKFDSTTSSVKAFQTELKQSTGQDVQINKNKILKLSNEDKKKCC